MACQESQAMAIHSPSSRGVLPLGSPPTFNLKMNCNVKSRLEFRPLSSFTDPTKIKGLSYTVKDPNVEIALPKTLTSGPWTAVVKPIGTGTGYFRIEGWGRLKRETVSKARSFTISW